MKYYLKTPIKGFGNDIWTIEFTEEGYVIENLIYDCEKPFYVGEYDERDTGGPSLFSLEQWISTMKGAFRETCEILTEEEAFLEMV